MMEVKQPNKPQQNCAHIYGIYGIRWMIMIIGRDLLKYLSGI